MSRIHIAASLAALAAAAAFAQPQTSNPGFFKPAPNGDTSLTKIEPPSSLAKIEAPKQATALAVATDLERIEAERVAALRKAEEDMDRSERDAEAERLRAQSQPALIQQGAYNGTTSERDR